MVAEYENPLLALPWKPYLGGGLAHSEHRTGLQVQTKPVRLSGVVCPVHIHGFFEREVVVHDLLKGLLEQLADQRDEPFLIEAHGASVAMDDSVSGGVMATCG